MKTWWHISYLAPLSWKKLRVIATHVGWCNVYHSQCFLILIVSSTGLYSAISTLTSPLWNILNGNRSRRHTKCVQVCNKFAISGGARTIRSSWVFQHVGSIYKEHRSTLLYDVYNPGMTGTQLKNDAAPLTPEKLRHWIWSLSSAL